MGCPPPPPTPEMTLGFLIDLHSNTRSAVLFAMYCQQFTLSSWLAISLLLRCLLSKSLYVTRQLRHSMVVHPLRKKVQICPYWLTDQHTNNLICWLSDLLPHWLNDCLPVWLTGHLKTWLRPKNRQTDWLTNRQRQTDWLTDQLTACLPACLTNCLMEKWLVFTSCKSQQTADVVLRFDQLRFWNLEVISIELWSLLLVLLQLSILVLAVKDKKKMSFLSNWVQQINRQHKGGF